MIYVKYLRYLLRHKWFVFVECVKRGQFWRGLLHDISKFLPDEFIPYARYFYGEYKSVTEMSSFMFLHSTSKEEVEYKFNEAWLTHIHRNKHHWQHWVLINDSDEPKINPLPIPEKHIIEMVCDWTGAGMAIHGKDDTVEWYRANHGNQMVEKNSREFVDYLVFRNEQHD